MPIDQTVDNLERTDEQERHIGSAPLDEHPPPLLEQCARRLMTPDVPVVVIGPGEEAASGLRVAVVVGVRAGGPGSKRRASVNSTESPTIRMCGPAVVAVEIGQEHRAGGEREAVGLRLEVARAPVLALEAEGVREDAAMLRRRWPGSSGPGAAGG